MSQSELNGLAGLGAPPRGWRGLALMLCELRGVIAEGGDGQVGKAMRLRVPKGSAAEVGP